jgi:hypothetical protein
MKRVVILLAVLVMGCGASASTPPTAAPSVAAAASPTVAPTPKPTLAPTAALATPSPTPSAAPMTASDAKLAYSTAMTIRFNVALLGVDTSDGVSCAEFGAFESAFEGLIRDLDAEEWPPNVVTAIANLRTAAEDGRASAAANSSAGNSGAYCTRFDYIFLLMVNDTLWPADDAIRQILGLPANELSGFPGYEPEPTVKPTPKPTPVAYATLTSRAWAKVVKAPDSYIGKTYKIWGCITQFDAATGLDTFRAQASYRNETYWYSDGVNAVFNGSEARLSDFVEDDLVQMNVEVLGSYSYDTSIGGSLTVPMFEVVKITRKGSCG